MQPDAAPDPRKEAIRRWLDRGDAAGARLSRITVGGNAGGVVAALSLIGATIGRSESGTFPLEMLWVLIAFLAGLIASGFYTFIDSQRIFMRVRELVHESPGSPEFDRDLELPGLRQRVLLRDPRYPRELRYEVFHVVLETLAAFAFSGLIIGCILGVGLLTTLAR